MECIIRGRTLSIEHLGGTFNKNTVTVFLDQKLTHFPHFFIFDDFFFLFLSFQYELWLENSENQFRPMRCRIECSFDDENAGNVMEPAIR